VTNSAWTEGLKVYASQCQDESENSCKTLFFGRFIVCQQKGADWLGADYKPPFRTGKIFGIKIH
jgi:hypothetical protein